MDSIFEKENVNLLIETRNLLDEVLETLDILADEESMKKLEQAREDVRKGRLSEFKI